MESEQMNEFRPLILVAEDDDSNFKLIKAIIGKKCDIEWAKNGQEMVELFQQHQQRAKAMLMDIKMPGFPTVYTGLSQQGSKKRIYRIADARLCASACTREYILCSVLY